jgi:hypothetical protein
VVDIEIEARESFTETLCELYNPDQRILTATMCAVWKIANVV